jgi:hypothetical protein
LSIIDYKNINYKFILLIFKYLRIPSITVVANGISAGAVGVAIGVSVGFTATFVATL